ncbi:MAG TPA: arginase family protein, partial [Pyrinomonadaceae bacterium]|nr:arginase family protein [Pyrinomonadaceae bacterium]
MNDIFQTLQPVEDKLFYKKNDRHDVRLGEIVPQTNYEDAKIVIVGCPQDEGVKISGGRSGSAKAPAAIREQFYQLTPFGISAKICDLGDVSFNESIEKTHQNLNLVVDKVLKDGKKLLVLGGGNDISYANGKAMADTFGAENWMGVNIS